VARAVDDHISIPIGFMNEISHADSSEVLLEASARWLPPILDADRGTIAVMEDGLLMARAFLGDRLFEMNGVIPMQGTVNGHVVQTGQPLILNAPDDMGSPIIKRLFGFGYKSTILVPIRSGKLIFGTLHVSSKRSHAFDAKLTRNAVALGAWMGAHLLIHRQAEEMKRLAETDPLTGSLNRRVLLTHVQRAISLYQRTGKPFSMILFDIDKFKSINDTYGHTLGDRVLIDVVEAVSGAIRGDDILARVGGEEFAVLLHGSDLENAEVVAERFRRRIADIQTTHLGKPVRCTSSFGVAMIEDDDTTMETIYQRADAALYRAKLGGRNRVEIAA